MRNLVVGWTTLFFLGTLGCATGGSAAEPLRETFRKVSPAVVTVKIKQRELSPLRGVGAENQYVAFALNGHNRTHRRRNVVERFQLT